MTRDDIYDHLAQVYLGKRKKTEEKKKKQFNAWLVINIVITVIIFTSVFYGLTAFLTQRRSTLEQSVIFSLHNGPMRLEYNFTQPSPPLKTIALNIPPLDADKYSAIHFSIRAKEEGTPGIVKIVFRNRKNELAYYYIRGVDLNWKEISIPLKEFTQITDWGSLVDVSFVVESWNVDKKKGILLIDDVRFSS